MKKISLISRFIIASVLLPVSLYSQGNLFTRLDSLFSPWENTPGCAVAIIQQGKVIYNKSFGYQAMETKTPISNNTLFNVGSLAKPITAFTILQLANDGKLNLGDKISKYIDRLPGYCKDIEVRHLLSHTSGIRDYVSLLGFNSDLNEKNYSLDKIFNILHRQKNLNFPPGTAYSYSNTGYVLLSLIIEKVSQQSFKNYAAENIFRTIGMNSTFIKDELGTDNNNNIAKGYLKKDKYSSVSNNTRLTGDNNLYTSLQDWIAFSKFLFNSQNENIARQMLNPFVLNDGTPANYGYGFFINKYRNQVIYGHGGNTNGFSSQMIHIKSLGITVIVLSNIDSKSTGINPTGHCFRFASFLIGQPKPDIALLTNKEGIYMQENSKDLFIITNKEGKAQYNNQSLTPLNDTLYTTLNGQADIIFGNNILKYQPLGYFSTTYKKLAITPVINPEEYAGNYKSDEVRLRFKIKIKNNMPYVYMKNISHNPVKNLVAGAKAFPAVFISQDMIYFPTGRITILFQRENGKITGATINGQRTIALSFLKR